MYGNDTLIICNQYKILALYKKTTFLTYIKLKYIFVFETCKINIIIILVF